MVYVPFVGHTHMGLVPPNIFRYVQRLLVPNVPPASQHTKVIYLRRPYPKLDRSLIPENDQALIETVRNNLIPPYELTIFESSNDWKKDREVFASAAAVFGPHGGAFSNVGH